MCGPRRTRGFRVLARRDALNPPLDAARFACLSDEEIDGLSDEVLMRLFHAGAMPAMGEIDRRYRRSLEVQAFHWLPRYLASRLELASDLVSNSIVKVLVTGRRMRARWDPT